MARRITTTPTTYRYIYEGLVFPRKELAKNEERGLARLLDLFEAVGGPETVSLGDNDVTLYRLNGSTATIDIVEETDFRLLKEIVEASRPNGLHVRTKLGILDYLDTVPKLEAKIPAKDAKPEAKRRAAKAAESDGEV